MEEQSGRHDAIMVKLTNQEKTVEGIERSLEIMGKDYHELLEKVTVQEMELKELKKKSTELESLVTKRHGDQGAQNRNRRC